MRAADLRPLRVRLRIAETLVLAAFLVLTARAAHLTLLGERGAARGESQLVTALSLPPERGRIVDRQGTEIAMTVAVPSIYAVPSEVEDADATAAELAKILGVDAKRTRERLGQKRAFVYIDRWANPKRVEALQARGGLPGIGILEEPRRAYPFGPLAASIVGFANIDGAGVRGVEQKENGWLLGKPRRVAVERDARGQLLLGPGLDRTATAGGDVALTIDVAMQAETEQALADGVASARAKGGYVVALDPKSGDVLALAELPRFDPNEFRHLSFADTRSRSFTDAVEPGSTFKTFLIAAALDAGVVKPTDVFDLRGGLSVPGKHIKDLHPRPSLDVSGILRRSSNVGSVKIAQKLGPAAHYETLRRFGFGQSTGSGFPDESSGILRNHTRWRPVDAATVAFGQGVSVTTVQLAAGIAALANDGVWMRPRLVRGHRRPGGAWEMMPPAESQQAVSPETAAKMRAMLEGVVAGEGGTGKRAQLTRPARRRQDRHRAEARHEDRDATRRTATWRGSSASRRSTIRASRSRSASTSRRASTPAAPSPRPSSPASRPRSSRRWASRPSRCSTRRGSRSRASPRSRSRRRCPRSRRAAPVRPPRPTRSRSRTAGCWCRMCSGSPSRRSSS